MDCSLPGPSVHRIFQMRILEWWVAISYSMPTLASKVDQLEGMLKMLREDLKKVNLFSKQVIVSTQAALN